MKPSSFIPELDGSYVIFTYDLRKMFGNGRIKVQATIDGYPYDGSNVNMGLKNPDGSKYYHRNHYVDSNILE